MSQPRQARRPQLARLNQSQQQLVLQEISELIWKGAVQELADVPEGGFVSTLFLVRKKWWPEASNKSEKSTLVCRCPTLQNEGDLYPQKPSSGGRLASISRPKGCLLLSSNQSRKQEVSILPVRGQVLPVQLSPLWSGLSPMGLYQDPERSSQSEAWDMDGCLHRQYSPDGRYQGESQGSSIQPAWASQRTLKRRYWNRPNV